MASIFLIGPMGSGKSTVGKALARRIGYPFLDADREIETRCGVDIPTIFEFEGETGFRAREKKIIAELSEIDPVIMATGGGAILNRSNRKTLRDNGYVIMLSVEIEEQLRRVSLNKNRPLLQGDDVEKKLRVLMDERRALYESTAHHIVSTNSSRMQNVVAKITRHLVREKIIPELTATSGNKTSSKTGKAELSERKKRTKSQSSQNKQSRQRKKSTSSRTSNNTVARTSGRSKSSVATKTQKSTQGNKDSSLENPGKVNSSNKKSGKTANKNSLDRLPDTERSGNNNKPGESSNSKRAASGTSTSTRRATEQKNRGADKGKSK